MYQTVNLRNYIDIFSIIKNSKLEWMDSTHMHENINCVKLIFSLQDFNFVYTFSCLVSIDFLKFEVYAQFRINFTNTVILNQAEQKVVKCELQLYYLL